MQLPFHPFIIHFPLALTFIMPVLVIVFAYMIKVNKMAPKAWLIIIGLQLAVVVTGYISLETGETEEERVEKVVSKELIHEHEESAEIFVGAAVITFVLSISAFFLPREMGYFLKLGIALLGIASCYLAYRTGHLGGELVYRYGAGSAYVDIEGQQGILPTPNENTSESSQPTNENESLKADENDYGKADNTQESEEEFKQED
jgi:uncharacterized membrane protein